MTNSARALEHGPSGSQLPLWQLALTVFACGASIMVLEVLGSRVIGPFFGVSLFVWTSLITVTMVALAAGYIAGGFAADRWDSPNPMYAAIAAAGALTMAVPLIRAPVLKACAGMGIRGGAFTSALILFGPPLFLLGCVSPYVVRLAAHRLEAVGRTVGALYGLSTIGSVAGTLLTGFVLIAFLEVSRTFYLVGACLMGLGALHFLLRRRTALSAALLLAALIGVVGAARSEASAESRRLDDGTLATLVEKRDGYYGSIRIIDYSYGSNRLREMTIDGLIQGGVDMASGLPAYEYLYFMEFLPTALRPGGKRCLVLGLGAGIVPQWYERQGIVTDVVEIDPNVVDLAREHFGYEGRGDLFLEDARNHLRTSTRTYDYLIFDVYNGDSTPTHLLSVEAFALARARLAPGGVLAVNLHGSLGPRGAMTKAVARTLGEVFDNVALFPAFDPAEAEHGNIAMLAYDGQPVELTPRAAEGVFVHPVAREGVARFHERRHTEPLPADAPVLTDDFNPMDIEDGWMREDIRREILKSTQWDLLI